MTVSSPLRIKSRKDAPCSLYFDGESSRGGGGNDRTPRAQYKQIGEEQKKQKVQNTLKFPSPKQKQNSSTKICQAKKNDGKRCTFKAKCFSKKTGKGFCGVHSKFCT